ncbi:aldehyde dehydrogenase family protein [Chitinimonas naiadis]
MGAALPAEGFVSCCPHDGALIGTRPFWNASDLDSALARSKKAAAQWAAVSVAGRKAALLALASALILASSALSVATRREVGKLADEADDEILRAAKWCQFLAERAPVWLEPELNETGYIRRQPLGVVLAVTPWNYPVWQIFRPLAAALMAGNAVAIKPANNVHQVSTLIETLCGRVLPEGLVQCLWLDDLGTRQAVAHDAVAMLVCTGSEATGRQLGALAGHHLKPAVLELGGNNTFLVLDDADLAAAAKAAAVSRCLNAGQACTAAKRFIVHHAVADEFTALLVEEMNRFVYRDTLAPIARPDLRRKLQSQIDTSVARGARAALGGYMPEGPGSYFPATVLTDVAPGMPAFDEELFGPVAAVTVGRNDEAMLALALAARQRLVASIWSPDWGRAVGLANRLPEGLICFNCRPSSRFELPFAGSGSSGYGSTLGRDGFLAFTRAQGWLGE